MLFESEVVKVSFSSPKSLVTLSYCSRQWCAGAWKKILVIKNTPTPSSKTELCSFLALAGSFSRYIQGLAQIFASFPSATFGSGRISWINKIISAFLLFNQKWCSPPVLDFLDFGQPFIVENNAPEAAVGAALLQRNEAGQNHATHFANCTTILAEVKYATCERGALAVILAQKNFRVFIVSSVHLTTMKDHEALRQMFQESDIHETISRWLDFLA